MLVVNIILQSSLPMCGDTSEGKIPRCELIGKKICFKILIEIKIVKGVVSVYPPECQFPYALDNMVLSHLRENVVSLHLFCF